jgi:hypothetical protein
MSKIARIRGLRNAIFLFSIFVGISIVELMVVWLSQSKMQTTWFFIVSFIGFAFYTGAYFLGNWFLKQKLRKRQITSDDFAIEIRIPTTVYALGAFSAIFLQAQILPSTTLFEILFNGAVPQADIIHYMTVDSFFAFQIDTYAYHLLESSLWVFNSNLSFAVGGIVTLVIEFIIALHEQRKFDNHPVR